MTVVDVTEQHKDLVDELLAAVSESNPDADLELLRRAFAYAAKAHELMESNQHIGKIVLTWEKV